MDRDELEKIISTYGAQAQVDVAIEEMSELTKALLKHRRQYKTADDRMNDILVNDIAEEIADVAVMLEQLQIIFDNRGWVEEWINYKIRRQLNRIKRMEQENEARGDDR